MIFTCKYQFELRKQLVFLIFCVISLIFGIVKCTAISLEVKMPRVERFTWKKSLLKGVARHIVQDKSGLLWFAGRSGVVVYDGYNITNYTLDRDKPSPVTNLVIDNEGSVFVSTDDGRIFKYSFSTDSFEQILSEEQERYKIISDNEQPVLLLDSHQYIVVLQNNNAVIRRLHLEELERNVKIYDSLQNTSQTLLATSVGLFDIQIESSRVKHIKSIGAVYALSSWQDNILVGSKKGLFNYKSSNLKNEFVPYVPDIVNSEVYSILAAHGKLWVGTYEQGVYIINSDHELSNQIIDDELDVLSLPSNNVFSLFNDVFNNVWIGTDGGVARYSKFENKLGHFRQSSVNRLVGNSVSSIAEDGFGNLWIGTHHDGISVINNTGGVIKNLGVHNDNWGDQNVGGQKLTSNHVENCSVKNVLSVKSIRSNAIYKLFLHSDGTMWVGHHKGIDRINLSDFLISRKTLNSSCNNFPPVFTVAEAYTDTWVGTYDHGLYRIQSDGYQIYQKNIGEDYSLKSDTVFELYRDKLGKLWVATPIGVYLYNPEKDNFYRLSHLTDSHKSYDDIGFNTILQVDDGEYWFGSAGYGVFVYHADDRKLTNIGANQGFKNLDINGIEKMGNKVVASTNNGLYLIDRATHKVTAYEISDGLQENEFNKGAHKLTESSKFVLGGINGFNVFSLSELQKKRSSAIPQIILTTNTNKRFVISPNKNSFEKISVRYQDFPISISLKSIQLSSPEKNLLKYRFSNQSKDWVNADGEVNLVFQELPFDSFLIELFVAADKAPWTKNSLNLEFSVIPPLWRTKTAYIIYILAMLVLIYCVFKWRIRIVKARALELEQQVNERTAEISSQKETIEKLANEQTRFFENISHEFRTPLTLIIGPVRKLITTIINKEQKQQLNVINRNAARLLNLIDQLLEISRLNSGLRSCQPVPIELSPFIDDLLVDFQIPAREAGLRLINEVPDNVNVLFDAESLQRILLNLTSNAIKYNRTGGTVTFSCRIGSDVSLIVADTGVGIEQDKIESIFDRFSRMENNKTIAGTGIGLSLVKELIELNNSSISVKSTKGQGTQFIIKLVPVKAKLASSTISHQTSQTIIEALKGTTVSKESEEADVHGTVSPQHSIHDDSVAHLLVVDDDSDMREFVISVLTQYHCYSATNGQEALDKAIEMVPDLIVTDAMMPVMDGFELIRRLRDNPVTNHIPILVLTARGSKYSRLEGLQTGTDDYLTKPFDELELCQRIENILANRQILRAKFSSELSLDQDIVNHKVSDRKFIENLNHILTKHFSKPEFSTFQFAEAFAMSERQLQRKLKAVTGYSPTETIKRYRLQQAKVMLSRGESVSNACYAVGFNSLPHFSRAFKELFQMSPSNVKSSDNS